MPASIRGNNAQSCALFNSFSQVPGGADALRSQFFEAFFPDWNRDGLYLGKSAQDLEMARLATPGAALLDVLVQAGLSSSKSQARKDIEGGGVYLNNERVVEVTRNVTASDLLFGKFLLVRKGKRTYAVLNVRSGS